MTVDLTQLAPFLWILTAVLIVVIAVIVVRFLWHHVVKLLVQGCAVLVLILTVLALLSYFKVIKLF